MQAQHSVKKAALPDQAGDGTVQVTYEEITIKTIAPRGEERGRRPAVKINADKREAEAAGAAARRAA